MTPHTQLPNNPEHLNNLPWYLVLFGMAAAKLDTVSMKLLLAIAGAIIAMLLGWGFVATHSYLQEIKTGQKEIQQEFKQEFAKVHDANRRQDIEQAEQRNEIKHICDKLDSHLKTTNNKRNGGGDLGDK